MYISEFLYHQIGLKSHFQDLQALDKLAGTSIGNITFYADFEDCVAHIQSWMPIYFFPIGHEAGLEIGIHLRPSDINSGRLAIIQALTETQLIEIALSLPHYIFLCLAGDEGFGYEEGKTLSSFETSVSIANQIFGQDFYQPGSYGYFIPDEIQKISSNFFGKSPYLYHSTALFEEDIKKKFDILQEGIASEPGCMVLYTDAAETYYELEDYEQAAQMFVKSFNCFHHTAYSTDLERYYEMGHDLIQIVPNVFPKEVISYLNISNDKERVVFSAQPYQDGDLVEAAKRLCDLCYYLNDYNYDVCLNPLKKIYSELGWSWALALCNLRSS